MDEFAVDPLRRVVSNALLRRDSFDVRAQSGHDLVVFTQQREPRVEFRHQQQVFVGVAVRRQTIAR